jgi:hypothetical protein
MGLKASIDAGLGIIDDDKREYRCGLLWIRGGRALTSCEFELKRDTKGTRLVKSEAILT